MQGVRKLRSQIRGCKGIAPQVERAKAGQGADHVKEDRDWRGPVSGFDAAFHKNQVLQIRRQETDRGQEQGLRGMWGDIKTAHDKVVRCYKQMASILQCSL